MSRCMSDPVIASPGQQMWQEIYEQPTALARFADQALPHVRVAGERWRSHPPRMILFAARGSSYHAALYGKYLFEMTTGIFTGFCAPSLAGYYGMPSCLEDALVIGISQSGEAADVIATLEHARAMGAETVAITNHPAAPLATAAHTVVPLCVGREYAVAATKTYTGTLAALLALAGALSGQEALFDACDNLPNVASLTLDHEATVRQLALQHHTLRDAVVLGRGVHWATASEFALKARETAYLRMQAFPAAEFLHGPLAMLDAGDTVFFFAHPGPLCDSVSAVLEQVRVQGAKTIMIASGAYAGPTADEVLTLDDTDALPEILAPLAHAIMAQLLAYHLAVGKGLDPDAPRGLRKVTITR